MKRSVIFAKCMLFVLIASLAVAFASCGVYEGPTPSPGGDQHTPDNGDGVFSVDLVLNGEPFVPPVEMSAKWTGEDGIFSADFDSNGHAEIGGLDGDYHVTLSTVPSGYTYDPNGYMATNRQKNIKVEMLRILRTNGRGNELYNAITISSLGTYRASLSGRNNIIYYEYMPLESGRYSIESWVDTSANDINPIVDVYNGTTAYKNFSHRQDDGGASSSYTKNFRMTMELTSDMVGNVWTFGLYAEARNGEYPVTVDFTIKYEGEFTREEITYTPVPTIGPYWDGSTPSGTPRYIYADTAKTLVGSRVKLYKWQDLNGNGQKDAGEGDDFYHLYDSETGQYGAILFAKVRQDSEVLVTEYMGTVYNQGFYWNMQNGGLINLGFEGKSYYDLVNAYSAHCDANGAHPVTEELKEFLQAYAVYQRFFNDGNGFAENVGLKSSEEDQWLFGCLYYA